MPKTETLARLRTENAALRRELSALQEQVAQLSAALAAAQARISELEAKKTPPPAFVKPNVPERPKPLRKKRAPEHNHARRLETPTKTRGTPAGGVPDVSGPLEWGPSGSSPKGSWTCRPRRRWR